MPNWRILLFFSFQFPRVPSFPFSWCVLPFFFPPQNCNLVDPKFRLPSLPLLCPLYLLFAVREQCQEISSLVAWFCSMWRVLFSISDDEKLVLVRVFLSLIVWMLSCPFSNACFFFSFFFSPSATAVICLLQQQRNVFLLKCIFVYCVHHESSKDTFVPWCSWRSRVYRRCKCDSSRFSSVNHCSATMFSVTLCKTRKDEISIYVFLVLIPSSSRAWQIYYRWDVDKQWLETWLRQMASL